jgi:hypothetical protein
LFCDGDKVPGDDEYKSLREYLSGAEKQTNAKTPDLRGMFLRGLDNGRGIDPGREMFSFQYDTFKRHGHTAEPHSHTFDMINLDIIRGGTINKIPWKGDAKDAMVFFNANKAKEYPTRDHSSLKLPEKPYQTKTALVKINETPVKITEGIETRPKNVSVNYIIKY